MFYSSHDRLLRSCFPLTDDVANVECFHGEANPEKHKHVSALTCTCCCCSATIQQHVSVHSLLPGRAVWRW